MSNGSSSGSSNSVPDLQAIVDRVVAKAGKGEQIEAYVSRGGETAVRVYQGEVEHFVSAQSQGVGIRVIIDGRTGTSHAGRLDEASWREVLEEARENAGGKWFRSPCVTLQNCIDGRPRIFDPKSTPKDGFCQLYIKVPYYINNETILTIKITMKCF